MNPLPVPVIVPLPCARDAALLVRYGVLETELETAPFHRVGTFWWDERTKEMRFINQRLGRKDRP